MNLPTLASLLKDEDYRHYFSHHTRTFPTASDLPWQIVALTRTGKWRSGFSPTFKQSFVVTRHLWKSQDYQDLSIIARNRVFTTPHILAERLCQPGDDWCGRCRRPTRFKYYFRKHHALHHLPIIVEGVARCYYCGIAREYNDGGA